MNILILNWRDPWHPKSGGAELFTFRIAEQLVQKGWRIEWFSAAYPNAVPCETRDGIHFIRAGNQFTVHINAWLRYHRANNFDVVIDEINTIPFFAHFYQARSVALMFQLAREVWLFEAPPFIGRIGMAMEPFYLRLYRNRPIVTISESSALSFRQVGHRGPIHIVPIAVDEEADKAVPNKTVGGDVIVIGRVTPSKRIDHSIRAAKLLIESGWTGQLHIVGTGSPRCLDTLKCLAGTLGIEDRVIFHGRVADDQRKKLLQDASALWMTSTREGWGLVVTEAARHGTPAVVYDVPGLRDAVTDGVTGFVIEPHPYSLYRATARLFSGEYSRMAEAALNQSKALSWEAVSSALEQVLLDNVSSKT